MTPATRALLLDIIGWFCVALAAVGILDWLSRRSE